MQRDQSAAYPLALLYAALIAYASLFPFTGWRDQGIVPWAYLWAPLPQYWTRFDVGGNLLGYMPLGFLWTLAWLTGRPRWRAAVWASLAAALQSLVLECLQSYLPLRVASNLDLALNAAGGATGALAALALDRLGVMARWQRFRAAWFVRESRGALVLLMLWPVGLLFPPPVAFGLGQVLERLERVLAEWLQDTPWTGRLPLRDMDLQPLLPGAEAVCVALGALVPCLLAYTVVQRRWPRALMAASALLVGVLVSALSAGLSYGPLYAWSWISRPVEWGLLSAVGAVLVLIRLPARACVGLLILALVVQLAVLNAAPQSPYFAATLQSWERGRFIHFNGLAQWVGWLWPFGALAYLASRMGRTGYGARRQWT
ncbi:VanZ family protein [Ottowia sp.]|uniref:VanZ family protein n=1 Tax=Ottowia sp. TaxID=1898956 RepID=UPI003A849089